MTAFWDGSHPTAQGHAILGAALAAAVQPEAVPEPLTVVLGGLGLGAVLARRRRLAA